MKRSNLVGQQFGKLLVLQDYGNTAAGHSQWLCICDCGKEVVRTATSLTRSKYSSCGCWKPPCGPKSPNWEGVGEISASWFYNVVNRAASGRKSRTSIKKKLDVSITDIWELFLQQDKKCALTGLPLTFPTKNTNSEFKKSTASLDRIDSNKGYVKNNLQWVHKDINKMKNIYSNKYFIKMCKLVSSNN